MFASLDDFNAKITSIKYLGTYTCYCQPDFTNVITKGRSSITSRGIFSKNTGSATDFWIITMGDSPRIYCARINTSNGEVTYDSYFSDDATVLATAQKSSPPIRTFNNEEDIDNYLDNFSNSFAGNVHYYTAISLAIMHSQLGGGAHLIEGYKTSNSYEWQQATTYSSPNGCYRRARSKEGGVWGEWVLFKNS